MTVREVQISLLGQEARSAVILERAGAHHLITEFPVRLPIQPLSQGGKLNGES